MQTDTESKYIQHRKIILITYRKYCCVFSLVTCDKLWSGGALDILQNIEFQPFC